MSAECPPALGSCFNSVDWVFSENFWRFRSRASADFTIEKQRALLMKFRGSVVMAAKSASSRATSALFTVGSSIHYTFSGLLLFILLCCFCLFWRSGFLSLSFLFYFPSLTIPLSISLLKWTLF